MISFISAVCFFVLNIVAFLAPIAQSYVYFGGVCAGWAGCESRQRSQIQSFLLPSLKPSC